MLSLSFEAAADILKQESVEFARIYQKHRQLDEDLKILSDKHYLTPEEEIHEKQMKKDKLRLKDEMAEMIRIYQDAKK